MRKLMILEANSAAPVDCWHWPANVYGTHAYEAGGSGINPHFHDPPDPVSWTTDTPHGSGFSVSGHMWETQETTLGIGTGDFSLCGWFKTNVTTVAGSYTPGYVSIVYKSLYHLDQYIIDATHRGIRVYIGTAGTNEQYVWNRGSLYTDVWTHVAASVTRGGNALFYINGELAATAAMTGSIYNDSFGGVAINGVSGATYQYLTDSWIFHRTITQEEVTAIYNWLP